MDITLSETEARIIGCLIEKEMATPEYYPLSLNALTNACNQKSNRSPVMSLSEETVLNGLDSLREKGLARESKSTSSRVTKYAHSMLDRFDLSRQEMAVLSELMLRGPQTPGELRSRAGRMADFATLEAVEQTLQALITHDPPLAVKLQREPGRKECRYEQLFSGEAESATASHESPDLHSVTDNSAEDKIRALEDEITKIKSDLAQLQQEFSRFKSQF
jgi:uncharacterized protein YceH (UPF0502 family)